MRKAEPRNSRVYSRVAFPAKPSILQIYEMDGGMQRAEHPDKRENYEAQGDLDGAIAREATKRLGSAPRTEASTRTESRLVPQCRPHRTRAALIPNAQSRVGGMPGESRERRSGGFSTGR